MDIYLKLRHSAPEIESNARLNSGGQNCENKPCQILLHSSLVFFSHFNNLQPELQHQRITACEIIGKTSECECLVSGGRRIIHEVLLKLSYKEG